MTGAFGWEHATGGDTLFFDYPGPDVVETAYERAVRHCEAIVENVPGFSYEVEEDPGHNILTITLRVRDKEAVVRLPYFFVFNSIQKNIHEALNGILSEIGLDFLNNITGLEPGLSKSHLEDKNG